MIRSAGSPPFHIVVARDGKTLTEIFSGQNAKGDTLQDLLVFDRQRTSLTAERDGTLFSGCASTRKPNLIITGIYRPKPTLRATQVKRWLEGSRSPGVALAS